MGIFDIFNTSDQQAAAQAQISGINKGVGQATGNINSGINSLNTNYTAALQPFLNNYANANMGVGQLMNVLGIGSPTTNAAGTGPTAGTPTGAGPMMPSSAGGPSGPSTTNSILQTLQNTPGYQFQLQQGDNALNARAAATGQLASGNEALALSNYNQGLAGTTYNNYVNQLMPFLGQSNAAASGIANVDTGLGNALAGQYNTLGNLNYTAQTGIGNANANADLAGLTASGNIWNAIGSLGGAALSAIGGGFGGGLGGMPGSAIPGGGAFAGPTSFGGPNGPTPLTGGTMGGNLFGSIFSDERLKENIEPVGELFDGTNVYRYNYKGDGTPQIGVMAQEVEQTRPDAVTEIAGFKAVDYGKATDLAASLAKFVTDDNVVRLSDRRKMENPADVFARFLEAA